MRKSFLSILLIFIFGCEENKFTIPLVQTGDVIEIDSSGVTFHGKIMNQGSDTIIDHGFVLDLTSSPTIESAYLKSLENNSKSVFSSTITAAFLKNQKYFVRALVKTNSPPFPLI